MHHYDIHNKNAHRSVFTQSLMLMWEKPIASFIVILVIALVLVMPLALSLSAQNLEVLKKSWDHTVQLQVFLQKNVSNESAASLVENLKTNPEIVNAIYISPDEGWQSMQQAGFGDILLALKENPLPKIVLVEPKLNLLAQQRVEQLQSELQKMPEVASVGVDAAWVKKYFDWTKLGDQIFEVLTSLFKLTALLTIIGIIYFYTMSSLTFGRYDKRILIFQGINCGLLASILAWSFVNFMVRVLEPIITSLANLYGSTFCFHQLSVSELLILLIIVAILSAFGAIIAVKAK